jgi:hypothetical protein
MVRHLFHIIFLYHDCGLPLEYVDADDTCFVLEDLPGHFAVWAASEKAVFLHGRFVWANWDVEELKHGVVGKRLKEDEHFLKIGVEGLTEKDGGAVF